MINNNDKPWKTSSDNGTVTGVTQTPDHTEAPLAEAFHALTDQLYKEYNIDKGVLVLRSDAGRQLAAVSTWRRGALRDGLRLNLPVESSLFEKVAEQGFVYTEDFCESFSGNFFASASKSQAEGNNQ